MLRKRALAAFATFAILCTVPALAQEWEQRARLENSGDPDGQQHLRKAVQTLVVTAPTPDPSYLCFGYGNNFSKGNQGVASVVAEITRGGDEEEGEAEALTVEKVRASGKVKKNTMVKCKEIDPLSEGDLLILGWEFDNMPRQQNPKGPGIFRLVAAVSGEKMKRLDFFGTETLPGDEPQDPSPGNDNNSNNNPGNNNNNNNNNPPPSNPGPPGSLSTSDQQAITSLFGSGASQIWLSKDGQPKKYTYVGSRTKVAVPGTNKLVASTAGYGNTHTEAKNDYVRKTGDRLPAGSLLSAADLRAMQCYDRISANGGPTSLRRDRGGKFHAEAYRPSIGSIHNGPYSSIAQAVDVGFQRLGC